MTTLFAQGDLLFERVDSKPRKSGDPIGVDPDGAIVLARGEATGHRHAIYGGGAVMFRDDGLARGMPAELYIGHVRVPAGGSEVRHEEHDTIMLEEGTWRVRRQREFSTAEGTRMVAD